MQTLQEPWYFGSKLLIGLSILAATVGCGASPTKAPGHATITATLDTGGGRAGFAATIYAQEVHAGKTFHTFMSAGSHGLVVLDVVPGKSYKVYIGDQSASIPLTGVPVEVPWTR
jgi:hypothetical protein